VTAALLVLAAVLGLAGSLAAVRYAPAALDRPNFHGRTVSLAAGLVAVVLLAAGAVLFAPLDEPRVGRAALAAVLAAGGAGVYDDLRGSPAARGLAGHLRALRAGRVTSGAVKMFVIGLGAVVAAVLLDGVRPRALADTVLVAGAANLLNLFDLRPGRALKVALVVTLPLVAVRHAAPLAAWAAGTAAGLLPLDLRERSMLGDGGANALGAVAGVAAAAAVRPGWALAAALLIVVGATLASERVSFSRVIDAVPPLRWADRLGRAG
jgi:UDP-N-acetylmuramyl pentapeptide phosphotransferase/UDP-N-acetylglucosamine-1-phosphate transferase